MRVVTASSPRPKPGLENESPAVIALVGVTLVLLWMAVIAVVLAINTALALAAIWASNTLGLAAIPYTWKTVAAGAVLVTLASHLLCRKSKS
jgi:uncharacterized membrane protein